MLIIHQKINISIFRSKYTKALIYVAITSRPSNFIETPLNYQFKYFHLFIKFSNNIHPSILIQHYSKLRWEKVANKLERTTTAERSKKKSHYARPVLRDNESHPPVNQNSNLSPLTCSTIIAE